jgi:AraC-like DNA-binding protein
MYLDFKPQEGIGLLASFAQLIGAKVEKNTLEIPPNMGSGFIKGYVFSPFLRLMVRNYELNQDFTLRRRADESQLKSIVFSFHHIFETNHSQQLPSVQIAVGGIDYERFFPSKIKFSALVLSIDVDYLNTLLGVEAGNSILNVILENSQPFLFEALVSPRLRAVAQEIAETHISEPLLNFYLKTKSEELICLILAELHKRENTTYQSLNINDVQKIYEVKEKILADLRIQPNLGELAKFTGMSESKLKRLFKQIFGDSIYNYYQNFRIQEAARLLSENKYSVSEVGYRLGFTNLSHFSKVFEEHIGMKPKKFSSRVN